MHSLITASIVAMLLDPTTYIPAPISYAAQHQDWQSSQPFFQHGWLEANPNLTRSARQNDTPLSYEEGQNRILTSSLIRLEVSALHNTLVYAGERSLIERHPNHKKLIKVIGWSERIGFAAGFAYAGSASNIRQTRHNRQLARELGY